MRAPAQDRGRADRRRPVASIASFAFIPQQFFPTSNRPEILVDLWLPEGTSFAETEREAKASSSGCCRTPTSAYVATFIGEGAPRFYLPLDQQLKNQNFAQLLVMSKSIEARERVLVRVRDILAHDFPNIRFKADRLFNGPPVGWAVQMRVTGPERAEVRRIADEVGEVMRATPQLGNVHDDWLEPVPSLKLDIDQDRARALGVTSQAVRRSLQAILSGFQIGEFREGDETIKVMLREPSDTRNLLSAVDNVYVKTAAGASRAAAPGRQRPTWCWSPASSGAATGCRRSPCAARSRRRAVARRRQGRVCQAEAAARRAARGLPHRDAGRGGGGGQRARPPSTRRCR